MVSSPGQDEERKEDWKLKEEHSELRGLRTPASALFCLWKKTVSSNFCFGPETLKYLFTWIKHLVYFKNASFSKVASRFSCCYLDLS